jgi:NitT/TauT family transport system substrate-binding protein
MTRVRRGAAVMTAGLLMIGATACGGDDDSANDGGASGGPTRIAIATGAASYFPAVMVQAAGIGEDKGVEVTTVPLAAAAAISALASGSIDVVGLAPDVVSTANLQGEDLRYFCRATEQSWFTVIANDDTDLEGSDDGLSWQDAVKGLEGHDIGIPSLGDTADLQLQAVAKAAGADYDKITKVPIGTGTAAVTALQDDQVDAILTVPFVPQTLEATGSGKTLLNFGDVDEINLGLPYAWAAGKEWLDADPERATALCDALHESVDYASDPANRKALDGVMSKEYGITDAKVIDAAIEGPLTNFGTELDCAAIEGAIETMVQRSVIPAEEDWGCDDLLWQQ